MQQFALSVQHSRTVSAQKRLPCTACFIGTAPPTARRPSARGASRRGPSHLHRGRSAPSFQPRGWAGVRPGSMRQLPTSTKSSTHTGAAQSVKEPQCVQAATGFFPPNRTKTNRQTEAITGQQPSFHFRIAIFLRFIAAYFSFTQQVTARIPR